MERILPLAMLGDLKRGVNEMMKEVRREEEAEKVLIGDRGWD